MDKREHWRGIMEWSYEGLPLSSPSNQACKMYDAALTQIVGFYDDPLLNGLEGTFNSMFDSDPDFVLGRCLQINLMILSTFHSPRDSAILKANIDILSSLNASSKHLTPREKDHVEATLLLASGDFIAATDKWEKILLTFPTDLHALKTLYDIYLDGGSFTGRHLRDTVARVLPFWQSSDIPLKGYLHGLLGFGFCETNIFGKAEHHALKALELNPSDGWATHALTHVYEMTVQTDKGIEFLEKTEKDWKICNTIVGHNYWHKALLHIENNNYEQAVDILDNVLIHRIENSPHSLDLADICSLLTRLNLTAPCGSTYNKQWTSAYQSVSPHLNKRISAFQDAHYLLACCNSGNESMAQTILESLEEMDYFAPINKNMVKSLASAIISYHRDKFGDAVELLLPIRYDLVNLGGSEAQRDLFNQILIVAAIKSGSEEHRKLAEHLLLERESLRPNSKLTASLLQKLNKSN
ncbi:tetratricopeptide repeat protein 38 [Tetranychus urticae]|uniref:Tetratricopeptide repeat protein 38 n=1 Tax=Tetranychus urticae TaxID=32264 RepID=T1JVV2_TETUR|nr:tetratricopeptide repeat protein 38 [Tetranychus urticae]